MDEVTKLFEVIKPHPTISAAVRMNNRSFRKMATVARMEGSFPYIQTGFVQRLTGFGWRMVDMGVSLDPLVPALRLMPASVGVAFTQCDPEIVKQRNRNREKVAATSHENRTHMIEPMLPAIELAKEVLTDRGVPVVEISTEQSIEDARRQLVEFAMREPFSRNDGLESEFGVSVAPPWWI